ncbi:MaoC family dehydratase [Pigmentiphaga soli]|uniref:MaoC family dehydratase n=1 Tax=Pigmentiphaga soli TaxID=1007095 RepID=A0ABP8GKG7_9BURK
MAADASMTDRPLPWRGYDDIVVGQRIQGFGRTVTDAEIVMVTALTTGWHQPLHTNAEWVKANTPFAGIILPGPVIVAYAIGLLSATLVYSGVTLAFLGVDKVAARAPVYGGDTITAVATVKSKRLASDPAKGIVELDIGVAKQDGTAVMSFVYTLLVRTGSTEAKAT